MTRMETRATGPEEARLGEEGKYLTFALATGEYGLEIVKILPDIDRVLTSGDVGAARDDSIAIADASLTKGL